MCKVVGFVLFTENSLHLKKIYIPNSGNKIHTCSLKKMKYGVGFLSTFLKKKNHKFIFKKAKIYVLSEKKNIIFMIHLDLTIVELVMLPLQWL